MVHLRVISGQRAGEVFAAGRFPVRIGRSPQADLVFTDAGVWDQHLQLEVDTDSGFVLHACPPAMATLNGQPLNRGLLRNGDVIDAGALRLQFWLAEPVRRIFRVREALTWAGLALLCAAQVALVYWISR
jgi:pSer/pThr/pTyr-binding forkhead associated (FHA) protein